METTAVSSLRNKLWTWLPYLLLILAFILFVINLISNNPSYLDSDMSSELILSKMLAEGKGFIITKEWFYSTELRFINTQLVFTPLFWIFDSWAAVRVVGTIILNLLLLACFYFFLRTMRVSYLFPWLAIFLLLPFSREYLQFVGIGTYYIPHICFSLLVLSFTFIIINGTSRNKKIWCLVAIGVLSLLAAIGGLRQIAVLNLPLALTALGYFLTKIREEDKNKIFWFGGSALIGLIASLIGYKINCWLGDNYSFQYFGILWDNLSFNRLGEVLMGILYAFGYQSGNYVLSSIRVLLGNMLSFLLLALFIYSLIMILKHQKEYQCSTIILVYFMISCLIVFIAINLFTNMMYAHRYNLPILFFALPICGIYLTQNQHWQFDIKKYTFTVKQVICWACLALMLVVSLLSYRNNFISVNQNNITLQKIAKDLQTDGYRSGYAAFWQANIITEMTNGEIEMWCYGDDNDFEKIDQVYQWLQKTEHDSQHPDGKIFMLFVKSRAEYQQIPQILATHPENIYYSDETYIVYAYENFDALKTIVED